MAVPATTAAWGDLVEDSNGVRSTNVSSARVLNGRDTVLSTEGGDTRADASRPISASVASSVGGRLSPVDGPL